MSLICSSIARSNNHKVRPVSDQVPRLLPLIVTQCAKWSPIAVRSGGMAAMGAEPKDYLLSLIKISGLGKGD